MQWLMNASEALSGFMDLGGPVLWLIAILDRHRSLQTGAGCLESPDTVRQRTYTVHVWADPCRQS